MLSLFIVWSLLAGISLLFGGAALRFFRIPPCSRAGDSLMLALWTGLPMLASLLLIWSLFLPITLWTTAGILGGCLLMGIFWRELRHDCIRRCSSAKAETLLVFPCLALAVSVAIVQPITNRDTLEYHLDVIQVMSRVGLPPGLGLVHFRYGFASSWFTLPALFNHGILAGRAGAIANGFAFWLMLAHLCLAASRALRGRAAPTDWFVVAAFTLGTMFPIWLGFPVSSTADFPVLLYVLVTAWVTLLVYPAEAAQPAGLRDPRLLPVFMGALILAMKPSAIPIPLTAGILYLASSRLHPRAFLSGGVMTLWILPWIAASLLTTGYWMYPASWRLDLPWTLGPHPALEITHWGQPGPLGTPSFSWEWLHRWLTLDTTHLIGFGYALLGAATLLWVLLRHRPRELAPCLLAGVLGLLFLLLKAPSVRFGWGYFVIIPCALFPLYAESLNRIFHRVPLGPAGARVLSLAGCLAIVFVLSVPGWTQSDKRVRAAVREGRLTLDPTNLLLLPPIPPRLVYDDKAGTVSPHTRHQDDPRAYLSGPRAMTYPLTPPPGVRFRDPEVGPRRGFEHE